MLVCQRVWEVFHGIHLVVLTGVTWKILLQKARGYGTSFHSAEAFRVQCSDGNVFVIGLAKL